MIDIVTVVFREELPVLKVQAQSVDLYCQDIGIQTIYVVVNDDQSIVEEIDPAWWGSLSSRVKIVHRDYFNCEFVANGWLTQQLLKLLAGSLSKNTWTMILDSKTIFVQPLLLKHVFDHDNRVCWGVQPISEVFQPARQLVSKFFNIEFDAIAGPCGVPFFFRSDKVRDLISTVTDLAGKDFSSWFQEQGMITEFILYTGFLQFKYGDLHQFYTPRQYAPYGPCNICHSELDQFDTKLAEMQTPYIFTVSIHRNCWSRLTTDQQVAYVTLLQSRGLTQAGSIL
jgi:hypothetical protein